jgi:hypothetical protein
MPITDLKKERLFAWLKEKKVRPECFACGSTSRRVGDIIATPSAPEGGGTVVGGPNFRVVQVICKQCAFVMHFATTPVGL